MKMRPGELGHREGGLRGLFPQSGHQLDMSQVGRQQKIAWIRAERDRG